MKVSRRWKDNQPSDAPSLVSTNLVVLSSLMDGCDMKALISLKGTPQCSFYTLQLYGPEPNMEIACFRSLNDAKAAAERMVTSGTVNVPSIVADTEEARAAENYH